MPSAQTRPPGGSRSVLILLTIIALGIIAFAGYEGVNHLRGKRATVVASTSDQVSASINVANISSPPPKPAAPGTLISAEEVLARVDKWMAEHPNYHLTSVSAFPNGNIMGKMDVFSYTNASTGNFTAISAQVFTPQAVDFIGVKKDGKFQIYFPGTDQLVEQDLSQAMASVPVMAGASGFKALLKVAKNSYAEASADLQVATLVLNTQTLKLGELPSEDIYLSIRASNRGELMGIDEQTGAGRVMTTMKYVTFDLPTIAREAPVLPAGKIVAKNMTLQQALQNEVRLVSKKPLGKKI